MEPKDPPIHRPVSTRMPPQSSAARAFDRQPHGPGIVGPELRSGHHENIRDYNHHPHPQPITSLHSYGIQEAIQREIEKSRIREEIIVSEIVRRHILESEVRRELRLERDLALNQGSDAFSLSLPSVMGFDFPGRLPVLGVAERRLLDERIARERLNGSRGSGWRDTMPFQRGTNDLNVSEAKPDDNVAGLKRKTINLAPGGDPNDCPLDDISRKKAREEWSCALCQVSATDEKGFNDHLEGKKHKLEEAVLRERAALKNHINGPLSKKVTKPDTVEKAGEAEEDEKKSLPTTGQESSDPKREKFAVWCEVCQVGTTSQKVMDSHITGRKHRLRLKNRDRTGKLNELHALDEERFEDQKPAEAIKPGNDDELVEECGDKPTETVDEQVGKSKEEDWGRDMKCEY